MIPFVSIIIPVYRNPEGLARCLEALEKQTYPRDSYEVLVVNNDPNERECERVAHRTGVRVFREAAVGSYAARNCGIRNARGSLLGFTDSDCRPHSNWIERAVSVLENDPSKDRVAGQILLTFHNPARHSLAESFDRTFFGFPQKRYVEREGYGATANLFVRRALFDSVGLFNPRLKSWGDNDWGRRASSRGFTLCYEASIVVEHPSRATLAALLHKVRRNVGGQLESFGDFSFRRLVLDCRVDVRNGFEMLCKVLRRPERNVAWLGLLALVPVIQTARSLERVRLFFGGISRRT